MDSLISQSITCPEEMPQLSPAEDRLVQQYLANPMAGFNTGLTSTVGAIPKAVSRATGWEAPGRYVDELIAQQIEGNDPNSLAFKLGQFGGGTAGGLAMLGPAISAWGLLPVLTAMGAINKYSEGGSALDVGKSALTSLLLAGLFPATSSLPLPARASIPTLAAGGMAVAEQGGFQDPAAIGMSMAGTLPWTIKGTPRGMGAAARYQHAAGKPIMGLAEQLGLYKPPITSFPHVIYGDKWKEETGVNSTKFKVCPLDMAGEAKAAEQRDVLTQMLQSGDPRWASYARSKLIELEDFPMGSMTRSELKDPSTGVNAWELANMISELSEGRSKVIADTDLFTYRRDPSEAIIAKPKKELSQFGPSPRERQDAMAQILEQYLRTGNDPAILSALEKIYVGFKDLPTEIQTSLPFFHPYPTDLLDTLLTSSHMTFRGAPLGKQQDVLGHESVIGGVTVSPVGGTVHGFEDYPMMRQWPWSKMAHKQGIDMNTLEGKNAYKSQDDASFAAIHEFNHKLLQRHVSESLTRADMAYYWRDAAEAKEYLDNILRHPPVVRSAIAQRQFTPELLDPWAMKLYKTDPMRLATVIRVTQGPPLGANLVEEALADVGAYNRNQKYGDEGSTRYRYGMAPERIRDKYQMIAQEKGLDAAMKAGARESIDWSIRHHRESRKMRVKRGELSQNEAQRQDLVEDIAERLGLDWMDPQDSPLIEAMVNRKIQVDPNLTHLSTVTVKTEGAGAYKKGEVDKLIEEERTRNYTRPGTGKGLRKQTPEEIKRDKEQAELDYVRNKRRTVTDKYGNKTNEWTFSAKEGVYDEEMRALIESGAMDAFLDKVGEQFKQATSGGKKGELSGLKEGKKQFDKDSTDVRSARAPNVTFDDYDVTLANGKVYVVQARSQWEAMQQLKDNKESKPIIARRVVKSPFSDKDPTGVGSAKRIKDSELSDAISQQRKKPVSIEKFEESKNKLGLLPTSSPAEEIARTKDHTVPVAVRRGALQEMKGIEEEQGPSPTHSTRKVEPDEKGVTGVGSAKRGKVTEDVEGNIIEPAKERGEFVDMAQRVKIADLDQALSKGPASQMTPDKVSKVMFEHETVALMDKVQEIKGVHKVVEHIKSFQGSPEWERSKKSLGEVETLANQAEKRYREGSVEAARKILETLKVKVDNTKVYTDDGLWQGIESQFHRVLKQDPNVLSQRLSGKLVKRIHTEGHTKDVLEAILAELSSNPQRAKVIAENIETIREVWEKLPEGERLYLIGSTPSRKPAIGDVDVLKTEDLATHKKRMIKTSTTKKGGTHIVTEQVSSPDEPIGKAIYAEAVKRYGKDALFIRLRSPILVALTAKMLGLLEEKEN